ncbi:biotin/lipoyl-containing protein [Thalassotalea fusca]
MFSEINIPQLPESTVEAKISNIYVTKGQAVNVDDILFDVETDKVVLEVCASSNSVVEQIHVSVGDHVSSNQVVISLRERQSTDSEPNTQENMDRVEDAPEHLQKDDSDRLLLEEVVGNSLFNRRGAISGIIGLVAGGAIGVIATVVIIG